MAKYSFVVGADLAFLPAANALFNSLDYVGYEEDLHLIMFRDFPEDYLGDIKKAVKYQIVTHKFDNDLFENTFNKNKADYMKRLRYRIASEVVLNYDATCFLDVDMFFARNVDLFFEIASHGIMLGCAKSGKNRYGANPSYHVDGKELLPKPFWNDKDICCCPIFFNKEFAKVFSDVYYYYTTDIKRMQASDLFAINQSILVNKAYDRLLTLPCHSWVGTNETMLKPYTRVVYKEGNLISENGDLVYAVHGKWFSEGWHNGQKLHMDNLIKKYVGNSAYWTGQYKNSMRDIFGWFIKMTVKHKINILNYPQYLKADIRAFLEKNVS